MERKPAVGGHDTSKIKQKINPEVKVGEGSGIRRNNPFGGGEEIFSLDSAEVALAFNEVLQAGSYCGNRESSSELMVNFRRQQVVCYLREDSQMQLQQQRRVPMETPYSPHHQTYGHCR